MDAAGGIVEGTICYSGVQLHIPDLLHGQLVSTLPCCIIAQLAHDLTCIMPSSLHSLQVI